MPKGRAGTPSPTGGTPASWWRSSAASCRSARPPGRRRTGGSCGSAGPAGLAGDSRSRGELIELGVDLGQRGAEGSEPLALLLHHLRRCALPERGVAKLGPCLGDLAFEARGFLLQALALRGGVDFDLQHE